MPHQSKDHLDGFDLLKAIAIILVVFWHADTQWPLVTPDSTLKPLINLFHYNICLLAVPIFFQTSLFLFYLKQAANPDYFWTKRLPTLLTIYGLWTAIGIVINLLITRGFYWSELLGIGKFFHMLVFGSRAELYFLFSLLLITFLAFLNSRHLLKAHNQDLAQTGYLVGSLVIITGCSLISLLTHNPAFSVYWNPICFLPYIFSSFLLFRLWQTNSGRSRVFFISTLAALFLVSAVLEWKFLNAPNIFTFMMPPYARPSEVIGAFIICYVAISPFRKPGNLVKFLSRKSLSIYLLHNYFLQLFGYLEKNFHLPQLVKNSIVITLVAISGSLLLDQLLQSHSISKVLLSPDSRQKG